MSSSKSAAASQAVSQNRYVAEQMFGTGLSAFQSRQDSLAKALGVDTMDPTREVPVGGRAASIGEPAYLTKAFGGQRGALTDMYLQNAQNARIAGRQAGAGGEGSNPLGVLSAEQLGQQLARQITGSGVAQAGSRISQTLNLYNMAAGSAGQAGNASLGFAGNQIGAMSMMPNYNQTYANILGGVNALGAGYGAFQKANAGQPTGFLPVGGAANLGQTTSGNASWATGAGGDGTWGGG